ncbi:hypothetical protein RhiirA4_465238 [Rhizophagus irregularis]|uniref:Uncharacterized protein n=1 Tax=Rhizophagus irregularis TaxID=588596 RepID=A0A2I1GRU2_9GLOM|nr:hypothetical protein RhiirA4_465238 [Rhizophagus irregularis]
METTYKIEEIEVTTWVADNRKKCIASFFEPFYEVYDEYLVKVVKCTKIDEYVKLEEELIGPETVSKPGKTSVRLNKTETKVPAVYYFLTIFLTKLAGKALLKVLDEMQDILYHEKVSELIAADECERIKTQKEEILENYKDLEKKMGDTVLSSELWIADLENRIRNLEADVTAKERIILEKTEANNILWEKIKALEEKKNEPTCKDTDMDLDNKVQKKRKRPSRKRKRARVQQTKNGTITVTEMGAIGDKDKDRLEQHFAEKSRDITFYDIPAYWSDAEIFENLNANVGFVDYMESKRCYKYKTVRAMLRFSKEYEKIYKEGGVNVSLTRNNRRFFIRMFDSRLSYKEVKAKFRWQAIKRLENNMQEDDSEIIKNFVKEYRAFLEKYLEESQLMTAINESIKDHDIGHGLWIKKHDDFIDANGDLQEKNGRINDWNDNRNNTSCASDYRMEREQQNGRYYHAAPSRFYRQWR